MTLAAIAPLLATLALWAPGLNIPERVTFGPEEEYMPSISPDGQLMAFVSNRDNSPNIWVISLEGARFSTPLRLTSVSSGGKGPAFSPDGKSVAYVSYGADAEGDIHRVSLPDKYGHGPEPEPITGFDTADREPAFFPDGKRILFTSISKTGAGDGLTIVDTGGKQATRLIAGGRSAAISPSGRKVAFIAPGEKGPSALHLASAEGGPAMPLASGEYIDASPVFASEDQIIFVRYIDDTNLDGVLTFDDRPALYRLDLASPASPPAPLTTTESFNLFPAVHGGVIYYTIQEGKSVDIYRLAMAGVVPTTGSLEGDMRQAEQVERFYPDRPALALLAWRAAWAVNHDDPDKASLAECLIHQAQLLERGGAFPSAHAALTHLMELYPGQGPQVAQAAVTLTRIEGQRLGRPAEWTVQRQTAHMERFANIPRAAAMARLERGRAYLRQGKPELALEDFRGVMGGLQATLPDLAAEAAFLRNEVYTLFGAEDKRLLVYLEVVEKFPEQTKWRDKALERIIELSMAPGDLKASILNLSALAEKYAHLPYVRAAAMEKQAQLYLQANETAMASQIYSHMARIFAGGPQAGAALLGLGKTLAARGEYEAALNVFASMEKDTGVKEEEYLRARRQFILQTLKKAAWELGLGEPQLAAKTYRGLIAANPDVYEAHRGLIQVAVSLGQADKIAAEYEAAFRNHPQDPVIGYSLALALTYLQPPDLKRAESLLRTAMEKDRKNPWSHQTLGWVYEQMDQRHGEDMALLALNEYQAAMAMEAEEDLASRKADLNLNLGNIHYTLQNCPEARRHYIARKKSGVPFFDHRVESLFYQRLGECEYRLGSDPAAVESLTRAAELLADGDEKARIEIYDRIGLARQSAGEWEKAAEAFSVSLALRRKLGDEQDAHTALRNLANNFFMSAEEQKAGGSRRLVAALELYLQAKAALEKGTQKKSAKPGGGQALLSIGVTTGAGGVKTSSGGFSREEEYKLIYHHTGRIYGELKSHEEAVQSFQAKLALIPRRLPLLNNTPILTEKAITLSQLGRQQALMDAPLEAAGSHQESLALCLELENLSCVGVGAVNMLGQAAQAARSGALAAGDMDKMITAGEDAVRFLESKPEGMVNLAMAANLLAQARMIRLEGFLGKDGGLDKAASPQGAWAIFRQAAEDMARAESLLKLASGQDGPQDAAPPATRTPALLSLAQLHMMTGRVEKALEALDGIPPEDEGRWLALYLKWRVNPEKDPGGLKLAAQAAAKIPFGARFPGGDDELGAAALASLFGQMAQAHLATGELEPALLALEQGRGVTLRLSLAPLAGLPEGERAAPLVNADFSGDDLAALMAALEEGEAVLAPLSSENGLSIIALTNEGLKLVRADKGDSMAQALLASAAMASVSRIYLLTARPFSDPAVEELGQSYMVSAAQSLRFLAMALQARNINDQKILAVGFGQSQSLAPTLAGGKRTLDGGEARLFVENGEMASAQVTAFYSPPAYGGRSGLSLRMPLGQGAGAMQWVELSRLIKSPAEGSLLITHAPSIPPGPWQMAAQAAALLAGYPSWALIPAEDEQKRGVMESFGAQLGHGAIGEAFEEAMTAAGVAPGNGRLLGVFGFGAAERKTYATANFKEKVRQGVEAAKAGDLATAAEKLSMAAAYITEAELAQYEAPILDRLSEIEYRLGRLDKALPHQVRLCAIFGQEGMKEKLAGCRLTLGAIRGRMGDHAGAASDFTTALELYRELGNAGMIAQALSSLGVTEENYSRYDRALTALEEAFTSRQMAGEEAAAAMEMGRIGRIYHLRLGDVIRGRESYQKALALAGNDGKGPAAGIMLDLAALEVDAGDTAQAEKWANEAMALARVNKEGRQEAMALFHLANCAWFRGEYERALDLAGQAQAVAQKVSAAGLQTMILNTTGLIHWTLNDLARAMDYLERSRAMASENGAGLDEASALSNIGLVYRKGGNLARAGEYFAMAMKMDQSIGSRWGMAHDMRNLAHNLLLEGDAAQAASLAGKAADEAMAIGDRQNQAKSRLIQAMAVFQAEDPQAALTLALEAGELAEKIGAPETLWRAMMAQARAQKALGRPDEAAKKLEEAVAVVERMRAAIRIDELKSGFLDDKQELYEELILLLLDQGKTGQAFAYSERSRARSFIDILGSGEISLKDKVSQLAYDQAQTLKKRIASLYRARGADPARQAELAAQIKTEEDNLAGLITRIRVENPGLTPFVTVEPVDPAVAVAAMDEGVVVIEYLMARNEVVAFTLSRSGIDATRTPVDRAHLEKTLIQYRELIQKGAPVDELSASLHQILVKPVIDKIKEAVVVGLVPHRGLHYLSFASLKDAAGYLIDKKPIFYLPSVSVYQWSMKRRQAGPKTMLSALALGNPDLGDANTDLPLSELEAQSIKWSFPGARVLVGKQATESAAVKNAGDYRILHIASHGQFDPVAPLRSALMLAGGEQADGALTAGEVFSMRLDAEMVVMSACQTGLGKVTGGDEVVGLNRAFLYSGARAVLSTLWRVDDLASAVLIKHFYRGYSSMEKAQALRAAQLAVKSRFGHPSYWAGFTLVGDRM